MHFNATLLPCLHHDTSQQRIFHSRSSQVVKLSSARNPMPFEYYHLPFCRPDKIIRRHENLGTCADRRHMMLIHRYPGEVLRGDRIMNTNYKVMSLSCICSSSHSFAAQIRRV